MSQDIPAGYRQNAQGSLVPEKNIRQIDLLRDETVSRIITQAVALNEQLKKFKEQALDEIAAFIELSAAEYNVSMGGKKGNVQLLSYDGKYKVMRAKHDYMTFDERLLAAKELITDCMNDWAGRPGVPRGLVIIAERAFRRNAAGEISVSRVMDLLGALQTIDDDRCRKAVTIITDSTRVQATVTYLRLYERVGNSDQYQQISLDIAGV